MLIWLGWWFCARILQIKCGGCGTVSDKETSVTPSELYDIPKSKGSANLVQKVTYVLFIFIASPKPFIHGLAMILAEEFTLVMYTFFDLVVCHFHVLHAVQILCQSRKHHSDPRTRKALHHGGQRERQVCSHWMLWLQRHRACWVFIQGWVGSRRSKHHSPTTSFHSLVFPFWFLHIRIGAGLNISKPVAH